MNTNENTNELNQAIDRIVEELKARGWKITGRRNCNNGVEMTTDTIRTIVEFTDFGGGRRFVMPNSCYKSIWINPVYRSNASSSNVSIRVQTEITKGSCGYTEFSIKFDARQTFNTQMKKVEIAVQEYEAIDIEAEYLDYKTRQRLNKWHREMVEFRSASREEIEKAVEDMKQKHGVVGIFDR